MASQGFVTVNSIFEPIDTPDGPMIFSAIMFMDFDIGKAVTKHFHLVFMDRFAQMMADIPGSTFNVTGTASMSGSAAVNIPLSQHRADDVMANLRGRGVAKEQIKSDRGIGSVFSPTSKEDFHGRAVLVLLNCPPSSEDQLRAFQAAWDADPLRIQAEPPD
jgi:outer membrane protein OmpA-like peptidoglycan-associated protein